MTYRRILARHTLMASLYAATRRPGLLRIECLQLEIYCLQAWLSGRTGR